MADKGQDIMDAFRGRPARPNPGSGDDGVTDVKPDLPASSTARMQDGSTDSMPFDAMILAYDSEPHVKPVITLSVSVVRELDRLTAELLASVPPHRRADVNRSLVANWLLKRALSDRE